MRTVLGERHRVERVVRQLGLGVLEPAERRRCWTGARPAQMVGVADAVLDRNPRISVVAAATPDVEAAAAGLAAAPDERQRRLGRD